jgi:hypothetical protein
MRSHASILAVYYAFVLSSSVKTDPKWAKFPMKLDLVWPIHGNYIVDRCIVCETPACGLQRVVHAANVRLRSRPVAPHGPIAAACKDLLDEYGT